MTNIYDESSGSDKKNILLCISVCGSYHIAGAGKVVVEQAFQGHPADGPVLIIPQTVVIHGKQVSGKSVVCDLYLHVVVNAVKGGERGRKFKWFSFVIKFQSKSPESYKGRRGEPGKNEDTALVCAGVPGRGEGGGCSRDTYTQFLAARSLCMTSLRAR